jgi:hypothetical protein
MQKYLLSKRSERWDFFFFSLMVKFLIAIMSLEKFLNECHHILYPTHMPHLPLCPKPCSLPAADSGPHPSSLLGLTSS